YPELQRLARAYLRRDRPNQTLQPTGLINEAYIRLIEQADGIEWESRSHFFGIAARLMRMILVDHARRRGAIKRGSGVAAITLEEGVALLEGTAPDVLEIDQGLNRLAEADPRKSQVIEMRYFGGMSREEIASAIGISVGTVKRDLRLGEAWLKR